MSGQPHIAIVTEDVFSGLGLKGMLEEFISFAQIDFFQNMDSAMEASQRNTYYHYFVSYDIWTDNTKLLVPFKRLVFVFGNKEQQKKLAPDIHFIASDTSQEDIAKSLLHLHEMAHHHFQHYPQNVTKQLEEEDTRQKNTLSEREIKIITLIAKGKSSKEIAKALHISASTVYTHRQHIMEKLNAHSAMKVVNFAINQGYIDINNL
ncbi:MAG TPA: hypothetical protein DCG33_00180 [Prevotellaceae bacterium]|jgi:DNA-binding CsgD family transcriptional regulator|nr:hypothetical protein [Prevotellaceae bacterium]